MTHGSPEHLDAPERVTALGQTKLMDTPAEEAFERLARLARRALSTPVAQVNLVGPDRQFSKSSVGPGPWQAPRTVSLDHSYCKHLVATGEPLWIEDAREHPLVRDNRATREAGIVAYAAAPLRTAEGHTLGSVCVVDFEPRRWSAEDHRMLSDLAETVMTEIRLRRDLRLRGESERQLRESEERFREIANSAPVLLWIADVDGDCTFFNEGWLRFTGRPLAQELGDGWRDGVHPDDRDRCWSIYRAALESRREFQMEYRLRRSDGTFGWVRDHGVPRRDRDGTFLGFVGSAVDVSEQKRAEAVLRSARDELQAQVGRRTSELTQAETAERHTRTILESITDAFFTVDPDWRFTYVNEQAEQLFGKSRGELLGRDLWELFPASRRRQFYSQYHRARSENVAVEFEEYSPPTDRWIHVRAYPSEQGLSVYMRDISARKKAEAALRQAKEEAETANRAKNEFLSRISHELRTPMNAILGFAQLLELELEDGDNRESVEQILRGGRHLLQLIDEVLDITRIETGRMSLSAEPVQVGPLVDDVIALVGPLSTQRNLRLSHRSSECGDRYVLADQQRLKQVLLNLLSNAIKYNREGGLVELSCEVVDQQLQILVSDTGRGIAPDKLSRLFQPFDRLGAEQGATQGTGLGLALSKALVEAMNGSIHVDSVPGRGSCFRVQLPLSEGPVERFERAGPPAPVPQGDAAAAECTILYIEDNLSNLRLVERIFARRQGYRIVPAMQGRLGLELAREHRPDLILLDVHLPDVRGDDVLAELQHDPVLRDIAVVVISADATRTQQQRLIEGGARDYLTKPFEVERLVEALQAALGREERA